MIGDNERHTATTNNNDLRSHDERENGNKRVARWSNEATKISDQRSIGRWKLEERERERVGGINGGHRAHRKWESDCLYIYTVICMQMRREIWDEHGIEGRKWYPGLHSHPLLPNHQVVLHDVCVCVSIYTTAEHWSSSSHLILPSATHTPQASLSWTLLVMMMIMMMMSLGTINPYCRNSLPPPTNRGFSHM